MAIGTCCTDVCTGLCSEVPAAPAWRGAGCAVGDSGSGVEVVATGLSYVPMAWEVTTEGLFITDRVASAVVRVPLSSCGDPVPIAPVDETADGLIASEADLYVRTGGNAGHRALLRISVSAGTATEIYTGETGWLMADVDSVYFRTQKRIVRVPKTGAEATVLFDLDASDPGAADIGSGDVVGGYVYFSVRDRPGGSSSIRRVPVGGGPHEILHASAESLWVVAGVDAAYFWLPTGPSSALGSVTRIDDLGSSMLPEGAVFPRLVGADITHLYFADGQSILMRPLSGGSLVPYPFPEGSGGPPWHAPRVDGYAYWSEVDSLAQERRIVRFAE